MWRSQFTAFKLPILKIIGELEHNYCSTEIKKKLTGNSKRWKKVQNTFNSMYHCILLSPSLFTLNIILILSINVVNARDPASSLVSAIAGIQQSSKYIQYHYTTVCPCLFNPNVIILNFIQRFTRSAAQTSLMNAFCLLRKMPESKFNLWLNADSHVEAFWSGREKQIQLKFTRTNEFQYC